MKIKKIIATIVSLALVGGSVVGGIYAYDKYQEDRLVAEVVYVSEINWGYFSDAESMYGRLTNDAAQEIYLESNRSIETVYVAEGDEVLAGDPLLKYDTREAELEMRQKSLEIETLNNRITVAQRTLASLRTKAPAVEGTSTRVAYLEKRIDEIEREIDGLLDLSEQDAKDNRIYNYITEDAVPLNAAVSSGTADDPYIICCNKGAFVYGSFFQKLGNEWYGKYVQFVVVSKDANGVMITTEREVPSNGDPGQNKPPRPTNPPEISPSSGKVNGAKAAGTKKITVPVADGSTSPNMVTYSYQNKPTVADEDDMWYVFTGARIGGDLESLENELDRLENGDSENAGTSYTAEELREEISEQEMKLRELDLKKRQEELTLASLQSAAENGVVYAKADGHVKSIADLSNQDKEEGSSRAFMVVTSDDGLYVTATISELLLDTIEPGTVMTANSWESGMTFEATVTEVSDKPATNMWGGEGNPNVSYYEFTAYVEDSDSLRNGEYVDLMMESEEMDESENENSLFIEKAYVRKEDGKAYCMVVDENERLQKRYVVTGKSFYDSIEVKAGLSEDDRIAFPYGKTAVEGALATETSE